jgi:hypothetical protein
MDFGEIGHPISANYGHFPGVFYPLLRQSGAVLNESEKNSVVFSRNSVVGPEKEG